MASLNCEYPECLPAPNGLRSRSTLKGYRRLGRKRIRNEKLSSFRTSPKKRTEFQPVGGTLFRAFWIAQDALAVKLTTPPTH